jgi:hypothetical protein
MWYLSFCDQHNLEAFPVTHVTLGSYVLYYVNKNKGSTRSIDYVQAALKNFAKYIGQDWMSDTDAFLFRKIANELKYRDLAIVNRKAPLTLDHLTRIFNKWGSYPSYQELITAIFLGHDALLRSAELLSLQVIDIHWSFSEGQVTVIIRRSKAKRSGAAEHIILCNRPGPCPYSLLLQHFSRWQLFTQPYAYVFSDRSLPTGTPIKRTWLTNGIKTLVNSIGLNQHLYSTHSLRAGGATDLLRANVPLEIIKKAGRWRSDEVLKYFRDETFVATTCSHAFESLSAGGRNNGGVQPTSHLRPTVYPNTLRVRFRQQKNKP